jgi:spore maturation protein CgeB
LVRLALLGERRRVVIRQNTFGEEYRRLLRRARIVFNRSIRGECNQRAFEVAAMGALLFQEAENREIGDYFRDRQECVLYTSENLEELLEYYLEHEDERRAIAEAGRLRAREYSYEKLWRKALVDIQKMSRSHSTRCNWISSGLNGFESRPLYSFGSRWNI